MNPLGFGSNPLDPKMAEEQVSVPVLSLEGPCGEKHRTTVGHQKRTNWNTPKAFVNFELGKTLVVERSTKAKVHGWYLIANNMPLATSVLGFVGTWTTISNRRDEANKLGLAVSQHSQYAMRLLPENRMVSRLFWQKWFTFYYRLIHHWRHVSISKKNKDIVFPAEFVQKNALVQGAEKTYSICPSSSLRSDVRGMQWMPWRG